MSTLSPITDTATRLTAFGTTTLTTSSPEVATLAATAATLGNQVAPLATTPRDVLGQASSVLSLLKPQVVVDQVLNIATGLTSINYPAILDDQVAHRETMSTVEHRQSKYLNNRCENSHQPTRQRERAMKGFRTVVAAQRFLRRSVVSPRTSDRLGTV